jgi:acyl-CoA hydrolase
MGGHVAHGRFFVGPQSFYRFLRELDDEQNRQIAMTSVLSINQLYGNEVLDSLQRRNARFINSCLMVTLSGAVVSDGLEDLRVVSGVGGQFNFVDMAHALPDGRSIIKVRSTRRNRGRLTSNIVWNYGHTTVPRHLRDLVVSEYGIAELRGKTDKEVIGALLNITDSRFQGELLSQAKKSGKLPRNYEIPETFRHNYPEHIDDKLAVHRTQNLFPRFPFGTDLTAEEAVLAGALKRLQEKSYSWGGRLKATVGALLARPGDDEIQPYLARLMLHNPTSMKERVLRRLVAGELSRGGTAVV